MKLNLGCGEKHKKGYINIDIQEPCDVKHDLRTPLPFDDNSVDEIFSEGFVRLLSRQEWRSFKKEVVRVLKPDGKLEIICMDLEYILKNFLKDDYEKRWSWWIKTIYSLQKDKHDFAKNGFTYRKLVVDFFKEGMRNFKRKKTETPDLIDLICYKGRSLKPPIKGMNILIGTPIHQIKDYCMEKWLHNVAQLQKHYPADLLMVDNSPGLDYVEKVKGYCKKLGITNYRIEHLEISEHQPAGEKIGRSREIIRQKILANDYDAWFSWECDQIIPINALDKLIQLMEGGNFMMVSHNSWAREVPGEPNSSFGCALINRQPLEKYGFLLEYPNMPDVWHAGENWFKKQILKGGGSYIDVSGIIEPIYHLNE